MASQRHVNVGGVQVGGGAPVVVQTMTKTETANLTATMDQIRRVADAGADMARTVQKLRAMTQVGIALGAVTDRATLTEKIMNFIFQLFPLAERAFILLPKKEGEAPVPVAARWRDGTVVDPDYTAAFARAHEDGGFDRVVIGYGSGWAEGSQVAAYAAAHTERLGLLVAHRPAAVLARVLAGRLDEAVELLRSSPSAAGPRRFTEAEVLELLARVGVDDSPYLHGARIFADLVPGTVVDEPGAADLLLDLELLATDRPELRTLASQLHVLARRRS